MLSFIGAQQISESDIDTRIIRISRAAIYCSEMFNNF